MANLLFHEGEGKSMANLLFHGGEEKSMVLT